MERKRKQESLRISSKKKKKIEKKAKTVKFVDLFCGIGGFHMAMKGFDAECVFACDIDEECQKVYKENYGIKPFGDISEVKPNEVPDHDILFAGFPCQPFSIAGHQKTFSDERTKPYEYLLKIIEEKTPHDLGYQIEITVLNTYDCGLPQNRERLFIIGTRNEKFTMKNSQCVSRSCLKVFLKEKYDYVDPKRYTLLDAKNTVKQKKSGLMFCGYINANLRKNGVLPDTVHLSRSHKQPNRIYHINGTNPTLSSSETSCRYYIYDGCGVLKLQVDDLYSIMGFPEDFKRHKKDTVAIKHIGNAVSPVVVKEIVTQLIEEGFIQ